MSARARIGIAVVLLSVLGAILGTTRVGAAPACVITWDGSASTSWHTAANWDLDRVPAAGDVACVPAGFTVNFTTGTTTIQTLLSQGSLVHSGGTLNVTGVGANESDVTDYTLSSGTLGGTGALAVTGTMTWTGGSMAEAGTTRVASGATLVRDQQNTVFLETGRRVENEGTIDLRTDRFISVSGSPAPLIHNVGTVVKSAGAGTATILAALENDGVVRSDSGTLELRGGGGPGTSDGDFGAAAATGTVTLASGVFTLADGARLLGGVTISGGTVAVASGATATASGANVLAAGAVGGTGTLAVTGTLSWTGGSMLEAGTTRVAGGGTLVRDQQNTVFLETGRVLENLGTIDLRTDRFISVSGSPAPLIRNVGTVVKSAGAGTATILAALENDGAVRSSSGTLELRGGGGTGTSDGDFGAAAAAGTLSLASGVFTLADGARLLGKATISGANVAVPAGATATASGANVLAAGQVSGTGELAVTGTLSWTGGSMTEAGTTRVASGGRLVRELENTVFLETGRRVENEGTIDLRSDRFISVSGSPAPLIHNAGTVVKSAGAGTATILAALENDGVVRSSSGTLELRGGGGTGSASGDFGAAATAGTLSLASGVFTLANGAALLGKVTISGASVDVAGGATATASGANVLAAGDVGGLGTFVVSGVLTWTGGSMTETGTTRVAGGGTLVRDQQNTVFLETGRVLENLGTIDLRTDRFISVSGSPAPLIRNVGSVVKSAGAGTATILAALENDGAVRSDAGLLDLRGGDGPGTSDGDFGAAAATGTMALGAGTFDLAGGARLLGQVTISGATVNVVAGATAAVAGVNTLAAGTIGGTGTFELSGTLAVGGGTMRDAGLTRVLSTGRIDVAATASFFLIDGRAIDNAGLIRFLGDRGLSSFGTPAPRVHNLASGIVRKTAGAGTATVFAPLTNDGLVESLAGRLELNAGSATVTHTGTFRGTSASALPVFSFGTNVLAAGADLEGWTEIAGGTVGVAAGVTLPADDQLVLSGGELTGPGAVSVTGLLRWTGGSQSGPGTTTVQPGARIEANAQFSCSVNLTDGRMLDNRGTISILGGTVIFAFGSDRPVIDNRGRLELAGSASGGCANSHGISGDGLVNNTIGATIEKLGGSGPATIDGVVDNDGQIVVTQGELTLSSTPAVTQTGSFRGSGGPVTFGDGTFELGPGATIDGNVAVESATLSLPDDLFLAVAAGDTLRMTGGAIDGGEIRVDGTFNWIDGRRGGPGTTTVEPGGTVNVGSSDPDDFSSPRLDEGHAFVNRGDAEVLSAFWDLGSGASILNQGTLLLSGEANVTGDDFGAGFGFASLLHNTGTLRKTGVDAAALDLPVDNDGTLEVTAGTLGMGRLLNWSEDFAGDGGSLTGGAWVVRGQLQLPGPLLANAARVVLDGPASSLVYDDFQNPDVNAIESLVRNTGAGRLEVIGGRVLTLTNALQNAGLLRIGPASRVVTPGYDQSSRAVLRAGIKSPAEFGQLQTPGTATLDGRLDAERDPAFAPADGQEFPVVSAGTVAGTFPVVTGTALGGGLELEALYAPPGVKLRVRQAAAKQALAQSDATMALGAAQESLVASDKGGEALADPLAPLTFDDRALTVRAGRWRHARLGGRTVSIAAERGATLVRRGVTARSLALLARTCRRCGSVELSFRGRSLGRVSLRSRRPARRLLPVATFTTARAGTVRLTTASSRRVAIDALVVNR